MELHVEFFVEDLERSRDFYTRVLGFRIIRQKDDGFTELRRGSATLALNSNTILTPTHPARPEPNERIGRGVEIVLIAEDLQTVYEQVLASQWPLSTPITNQPWGMTDFRLVDPDGSYIRVTPDQQSDAPANPPSKLMCATGGKRTFSCDANLAPG